MVNYKLISMLSSLFKIIEKLLHTCLMTFFNRNNVINPFQLRFGEHYNTTTAVIDMLNHIIQQIDSLISLLLFIDISKTFDSLSHNILLQKLLHYGIWGNFHKWFSSCLSCWFHRVQLGNFVSSLVQLVSGVSQGFTFGPILWVLYVHDAFNLYKHWKLVLFADDTCIAVSAMNVAALIQLYHEIFNVCSEWFASNILALNIKKTYYMIVGNIKRINVYYYHLTKML